MLAAIALFARTRGRAERHLAAVLACNAVFYAFAGPAGFAVLVAECLVAWTGARLIDASEGAQRLRAALVATFACLAFLAIFKYTGFAFDTVQSVAVALGLTRTGFGEAPEIAYIAGISFFTFQTVGYLIDVYRKAMAPMTLADTAAFVSFFPTIMSGPILRAGDFSAQLHGAGLRGEEMRSGFVWILSGFVKKVVIASYLSEFAVKGIFNSPEGYSSLAVLFGTYAYAIQIYCDFSGYTDIAVGVGRLLGYRLPDNFLSPYLAVSVQDFWRRWHITLSLWLRDYLYFPLGGSRRGNVYANLVLTMLIGGLWHGSAWTFVVWGGCHGAALAIHRAWAKSAMRFGWTFRETVLWRFVSAVATFHVITALWVFFRAESLDAAWAVFSRLFAFSASGQGLPVLVPATIAAGLALQFAGPVFRAAVALQKRLPWYIDGILFALAASILMALGPDGVLPFIYFGF